MNEISDKEIIELFRDDKSKSKAFDSLVNKYKRKLYHHIRSIVENHDDTDDVLQNTFIKIFENLSSFREDSKLFTWIYRIATNEAINFLKSRKSKIFFKENNDIINNVQKTENTELNADQIQNILKYAINQLPEKQRMIFLLRYYEELKYEEISEILNTSVGALKASYHIAVKKIEEIIRHN